MPTEKGKPAMRHKLVLVALVAVAMAALGASRRSWAGTIPINLLPIGDSITQQGYYINPLTTLLNNNGYKPTVLFNEGHSGYVIAHQYTFNGIQYTSDRSGLLDSITTYMNHPGVNADNSYVLLMIGTNDVDTGFQLADANVKYRLGRLITSITTIAPRAHLIVAEITPNLGSIPKDTAVEQFNTDVAACVATAVAANEKVSLVDMYDAFSPRSYQPYTTRSNPFMNDTLHPNQTGGNAMAQVWFNGIQVTQAPEPSTLVLLGSALLGLLGYVRLRRRR
jgi:lysophospholipase L1-like esterase